MIASPPAARTAAAIRSSSVATITRATDFAFDACRHTRTIIGTPEISASAFAGRREDAYRAGTTAITETSARNFLRCSRLSIRGAHTLVAARRGVCQFRAARLPTPINKGEYALLDYRHGGEYQRGLIHTNNMESFWPLLKRRVIGRYHNVSKKYLPFYLNEFSWRFNNRNNPNAFADLITTCDN
jgi:hypothetical protein